MGRNPYSSLFSLFRRRVSPAGEVAGEEREPPVAGRPQLVVGLTGGVGSGKSEVARRFRELGAAVIDADEIARELTLPGQPALREILDAFGREVQDEQGRLDRAALRRLVFSDEAARRRLENILHPRIRERMEERLAQVVDAPYAILVIPLLLETRQQDLVDRILVVDADPQAQIRRVCARDGVDEAQVRAIMAVQVDRETRLGVADDLIVNDDDLQALYQQVDALHRRYLRLAEAGPEGEEESGEAGNEAVAPAEPPEPPEPSSITAPARPVLDLTAEDRWVVYELPLNERMRLLLRLEALFQAGAHYRAGDDPWDSRAAMGVLLDLLETCSRLDVRKELLQELDRLHAALKRYIGRPGVDDRSLEVTLNRLQRLGRRLREGDSAAQELRDHELLLAIHQRMTTAGAACSFDLPAYYHWANRPPQARRNQLDQWFGAFAPLEEGLAEVLDLLRGSATPRTVTAEGGFFQETLKADANFQLIRFFVPASLDYYAEPSGARQRYSVRFRAFDARGGKGPQAEEDIVFRVSRCAL